VVIVDEAHGGTVTFPPVEDMIADRLGQYESDPSGRADMLAQARLLALDVDYPRKRVQSVDPALIDRLAADV